MNKLVILISTVVILSSCSEDRFNILPNDKDTPESIFVSESNYRTVLDGAYDHMKTAYSSDTGNMLVIGDALADNLIFSSQGRQTNKRAYEWNFSPEDLNVTKSYKDHYTTISRANLVLDNVSKIPSSSFMKNIEAEAKGIRAISHFELARAYSQIPTQSADAKNSLGIAYVTTFNPGIKPSRDGSVKETYDKILNDLLSALNNIGEDNGPGRLNKTVIEGYLSKVYLYLGEYDKVIEYGEKVIAKNPSVGSLANFSNIWNDQSEDGVLFSILNNEIGTDNVGIGTGFYQSFPDGKKSEFYANYGLVKEYKDTDIRKNSYILKENYLGVPRNHVVKYDSKGKGHNAGVVTIKLLRTADIYLTVAEAYTKASSKNEAKALDLLNKLRQERYKGFNKGVEAGDSLKKAILEERRLELAFENDRFWTIKRLGESVVRSSYGSFADGKGTDAPAVKTLPAGDHRFVLPIPASAIRINPNIQQNKGY